MKVAIVHYWLVNMRGGEKMLEALLEMFPDADIYTHVHNPKAVSARINSHRVYTSAIQKLPFAVKLYQKYMPLMPRALMDFDLSAYDLVISSEAGPAKGVTTSPEAFHLCYCHSPMRYVWDLYHEYFRGASGVVRFFMKRLIPALRLWDVTSANMVDRFITNSRYVAKRMRRYYQREAEVVFGPVEIEKFLPRPRNVDTEKGFYLFFGQVTGYKRADIAIDACVQSGRRLVVAGDAGGSPSALLRKIASSPEQLRRYRAAQKAGFLSFTGRITDAEAADYFSRARALLFPGIEDLGLVPIEANAAGCPVIAYRRGGVLDTVLEGVTGLFFDRQSPESLMAALDTFESTEAAFAARPPFTAHVQQFSKEAFKGRIAKIVAEGK